MQQSFPMVASLSPCLILTGSSEPGFIKNQPGNSDALPVSRDYISAGGSNLLYSNHAGGFLPFLFRKEYDTSGESVVRITTVLRAMAIGHFVDNYETYLVESTPVVLRILNCENKELAYFRLKDGKPVYGHAYLSMSGYPDEELTGLSFEYSDGKLVKIRGFAAEQTADIVEVKYDATGTNVKSLIFNLPGSERDRIDYNYDYSMKVSAQYYPDELCSTFWSFLKYLNLFPELQGENLLSSSYCSTGTYPGDIVRSYSNHQFDVNGRLTSFYLDESMVSGYSIVAGEWTIAWK